MAHSIINLATGPVYTILRSSSWFLVKRSASQAGILTLAELCVSVLTSFIIFDKALTN